MHYVKLIITFLYIRREFVVKRLSFVIDNIKLLP